ncbi:Protein of unknown function [Pyronema omphalodes CBS 100304]|uniref:Uncharacterized protein n=1 Tax=Pyronema omphalodes (strain CBS 100304) TaxID=1076935 RepID=U4L4N2_PYROM|nr:Protein of unknown function [Pyronema omphalodes CBS 100304]
MPPPAPKLKNHTAYSSPLQFAAWTAIHWIDAGDASVKYPVLRESKLNYLIEAQKAASTSSPWDIIVLALGSSIVGYPRAIWVKFGVQSFATDRLRRYMVGIRGALCTILNEDYYTFRRKFWKHNDWLPATDDDVDAYRRIVITELFRILTFTSPLHRDAPKRRLKLNQCGEIIKYRSDMFQYALWMMVFNICVGILVEHDDAKMDCAVFEEPTLVVLELLNEYGMRVKEWPDKRTRPLKGWLKQNLDTEADKKILREVWLDYGVGIDILDEEDEMPVLF